MIHRPLTYHESMRILIEGVSGSMTTRISTQTGLSRGAILNFLHNKKVVQNDTVETLAWFIWKKMNATVLLSDSDRRTE